VSICTTSPELNKLHPPRDSKQLGGLASVHETGSGVDEHTVRDSGLCLHRTQAFTSISKLKGSRMLSFQLGLSRPSYYIPEFSLC
jgi:hypothetical protein